MSHGPFGLGGGALLCACAGAPTVNVTPMRASTSAERAAHLLRRAPRRAASAREQPLRVCGVPGSWLSPRDKRLIARPLLKRSRVGTPRAWEGAARPPALPLHGPAWPSTSADDPPRFSAHMRLMSRPLRVVAHWPGPAPPRKRYPAGAGI